jgi:AhpD family alkylhydroperoxidase
MRVLYPRLPGFVRAHLAMVRYAERRLSLPTRLRHLVEVRVSRLNGCSFCSDAHEWMGRRHGVPPSVFAALDAPSESSLFDAREQAALAYAEAVSRRRVDDALFDRVRALFSEREIAELTFLAAYISYLNMMSLALALESDGLCSIAR